MSYYIFGLFGALSMLAALPLQAAQDTTPDLAIRGGRVVDGTGNPAIYADIGIKNGRIIQIGKVPAATREIQASNLVVCPGFIDVHTHADEVDEMPLAENFVRMGVTTVIAGNCGSSILDLGKLFRRIEATNAAVNVASMIGHNDVREKAMGGRFDRPPTPEEMARMKAMVKKAMEDGAVGLSTGLIYHPGVFSTTEEIIELAREAAAYGGIYTSHMRHEDEKIDVALNEVFRIARETGIRAEVSHIKLSGPNAWGKASQVLELLEKARADGLEITQDQYTYTASSTSLGQLIPDDILEGGRKRYRERIADPVIRSNTVQRMVETLRKRGRDSFAYAVIASYDPNPELNGLNVQEAAKKVRNSDTLEEQAELVLEVQKNGGASAVFHGIDETDLQTFMRHPNTMVASDSGLRKFGEGVPHPRGYGNNARILARYVRELKVLRLEDAIRKMTSLPANTFRLKDRGLLREGNWADVVVFNPETVQDTATFKQPHAYPTGIKAVVVNGVIVLEDGKHTGAKAGQVLRRGS
jgi:N-acyl-D-amino-acid deacylase